MPDLIDLGKALRMLGHAYETALATRPKLESASPLTLIAVGEACGVLSRAMDLLRADMARKAAPVDPLAPAATETPPEPLPAPGC